MAIAISNFVTSGVFISSTSNDITTYTLTRSLNWTDSSYDGVTSVNTVSGGTGVVGLVATSYIELDTNIIINGNGHTINLTIQDI